MFTVTMKTPCASGHDS